MSKGKWNTCNQLHTTTNRYIYTNMCFAEWLNDTSKYNQAKPDKDTQLTNSGELPKVLRCCICKHAVQSDNTTYITHTHFLNTIARICTQCKLI